MPSSSRPGTIAVLLALSIASFRPAVATRQTSNQAAAKLCTLLAETPKDQTAIADALKQAVAASAGGSRTADLFVLGELCGQVVSAGAALQTVVEILEPALAAVTRSQTAAGAIARGCRRQAATERSAGGTADVRSSGGPPVDDAGSIGADRGRVRPGREVPRSSGRARTCEVRSRGRDRRRVFRTEQTLVDGSPHAGMGNV